MKNLQIEKLYDKILNKIDNERIKQNLSLKDLEEITQIHINRLLYLFSEKYQEFDVRMKLDELLKLCIALNLDINIEKLN